MDESTNYERAQIEYLQTRASNMEAEMEALRMNVDYWKNYSYGLEARIAVLENK